MNRIGVYLLLLAIGVQFVTLQSQRTFVADPVELAHSKVVDEVEVEKPTGRLNFDSAGVLCIPYLATADFTWHGFRCHSYFCLSQRADAHFQRGPPALI